MKKGFISIILFLLFLCSYAHSQEFVVRLRLKSIKDIDFFTSNTSPIKPLSTEYQTKIYQSYPGAKNPELFLLFTLRGNGNRDAIIKEYFATGKFDESFIGVSDTVHIAAGCSNPLPINEPTSMLPSWQLDLIDARCAWTISKGSSNVLIGIADTDFDPTHQDLQNKYEYIIGPVSAGHYHGTSVASIAGAAVNNGIGIAGIGYNCKIAAHRVMHWLSGSSASAYGYDISEAIWSLYRREVKVINVSWENTGLNIADAEEITQGGTTLVLAGGNNTNATNHSNIANIPGVIVVSGVDRNNMHGPTGLAHNQWIDICALGYDVVRATPNNAYFVGYGTSYATPFVTGTVALMNSVNPNLTPDMIEYIIKSTANPIIDGNQYQGLLGAGLLDAYESVQNANCYHTSITGIYPELPTTYKRVICREIDINATVPAGTTLILDATNKTTINPGFKVEAGAHFIVR